MNRITDLITTTRQRTTSPLGSKPDTPSSVSEGSSPEWNRVNGDGTEDGGGKGRRKRKEREATEGGERKRERRGRRRPSPQL